MDRRFRTVTNSERRAAKHIRQHELERFRVLEPRRPQDFFGRAIGYKHRKSLRELRKIHPHDVPRFAYTLSRMWAPLGEISEQHEKEAMWWAERRAWRLTPSRNLREP